MQDSEKLKELYQLYEKPFYHIAYAILHHHQQAEDAVSDAFEKIIFHLHKIDKPESPRTKQYMISVIRHTAINQYRKNKRQNQNCTDWDENLYQIADTNHSLENHIRKQDLREMLTALFSVINETDKQIILLHCQDGMTFGEIAGQLHMKETAVRKRFERARKRMILQKEGFHES